MQRPTPIFIVTSSRPRVGKTLVARALIEYFAIQRRPVSGFDVNPDEFALLDYLPGYAAAATLRDTRGEIALFDQLITPDEMVKVVDLGHSMFERFFAVMQLVNFATEARRHAVMPMVLFVADRDDRAHRGYAMLNRHFPDLALVAVLNEARPQISRFDKNFAATQRGGAPVSIPALSAVLRSVVDRPGFSFLTYAAKSRDTTAELYSWMRRVFLVFRDLEVRGLLGELKPELKHSA
jgi:hypothetical protein